MHTGPQPKVNTPGVAAKAGEFRRLAEAEDLVHRGLVRVGGVVEHLGHPHRLDDPRHSGKHKRQNVVGEAGVDAGGEERHPAVQCGLPQRLGERRDFRPGASGNTNGTNEHDTTFLPARRIDTMSSTASSGRRLAPAAYTTTSASPASSAAGSCVATTPTGAIPHSFSRVATGFGIAVHDDVDQFQLRVVDHPAQGDYAHGARTPNSHLQHQKCSPNSRTVIAIFGKIVRSRLSLRQPPSRRPPRG